MRLIHIIFIVLLLAGCSHSDDDNGPILPGDGDDRIFIDEVSSDKQIQNGNAVTSLGTYRYYNIGAGGRMAYRIGRKGISFGRSFIVIFSDGYKIKITNSARRNNHPNGFIYRPGTGRNGSPRNSIETSHGGIYIYAPYGNKSQTLTIVR